MIDALYIAATGMHAEQKQLDTIAHNMSNINTPAFKKGTVSFNDIVSQGDKSSASLSARTDVGMGSVVQSVSRSFEPGDLKNTGNPFDIAITGQGFLEVEMPNGSLAYTRDGSLKIGESGRLMTRSGYDLSDQIRIPPDALSVTIGEDGKVEANMGAGQKPLDLGSINIASFTSTSELQSAGNSLYLATDATGTPFYSTPGENGTGVIRQNHIETSNVDLVEELLSLTVAQRVYEVNSQVIRAADEIMKINNNLRI